MRSTRSRIVRAAVAVALTPLALAAQESTTQKVEVHGFGGWNYGATDNANLYLGGKKDGTTANSNMSLNVSSQVSDRFSVSSQLSMQQVPNGETETDLDYAFGEWRVSDAFKLRAGLVKQPFGIYTEVYDVGTIRPFLTLPQSIYGRTGVLGEAYRGAGFTGLRALGSWELAYDGYVGALNRIEDETPGDSYRVMNGTTTDTLGVEGLGMEATDRLYGGRFWLATPVTGLRVGGSGYRGTSLEAGQPDQVSTAWATSLEYVANRVTVRGEYTHYWEEDNDKQTGYYVEGAIRPYGKWEIAGLFDEYYADLDGPEYRDAISLLQHREQALGLNYRFSPNFVVKLSHHWVDGNRFAMPSVDVLFDRLRNDQPLQRKTKTVLFGAQLSF